MIKNTALTLLLSATLPITASCATTTGQSDKNGQVENVTFSTTKDWGTWQGWGASLAWWGKLFGDREDLADLFYTTKAVTLNGETLPGLDFNIVRYNAGACSWREFDGRKMVVSNDILPFRQIEGYWLDGMNPDPSSSSWDWSVDANQRKMMLMAKERGANLFELFSNSPMWWMCKNDNPSGAAKGDQDNLSPSQYHNFAYYLATIARHAKDDWGVTFNTVAAFNEPTSNWWNQNGKQEGCHVSATEQQKILPLVRAALDAQGLQEIDLSASDESLIDQAIAAWQKYTPESKSIVKQVNVHGYQGAGGDRNKLYQMVHVQDGKRLWNSEHGDKDPSGLELALNLHHDFAKLHPTAWCYWQPIDGGRHGKGGSGWGLVDSVMNEGKLLNANGKLFVLAQYSRHIKPGMLILDTDSPHTVVAYDRTTRKLVIVSVNDSDQPKSISYDLSAVRSADNRVVSWLTETAGNTRYAVSTDRGSLKNHQLTAIFPAKSIQTFELTNVTFNTPQS